MDICPRGERDLEELPENDDGLSKLYPHIHTDPIVRHYCRDTLLLIGDDTSSCEASGEMIDHH